MNKADLLSIITEAHVVLESIPDEIDMETHFQYALSLESSLQRELAAACEGASKGTENMLAALADESEVRVYKIRQRVK